LRSHHYNSDGYLPLHTSRLFHGSANPTLRCSAFSGHIWSGDPHPLPDVLPAMTHAISVSRIEFGLFQKLGVQNQHAENGPERHITFCGARSADPLNSRRNPDGSFAYISILNLGLVATLFSPCLPRSPRSAYTEEPPGLPHSTPPCSARGLFMCLVAYKHDGAARFRNRRTAYNTFFLISRVTVYT